MNPTTVICLLCAVPFSSAVCLAVYALVRRRQKVGMAAIALTILSIALPVAYYFHVQSRVRAYAERLGDGGTLESYEREQLASMGPWAVPALTKLLGSESADKRVAAIDTLGRIGPSAADVVPRLKEYMQQKAPMGERLWIHSALARIGDSPEEHVSVLVSALNMDDPQVHDVEDLFGTHYLDGFGNLRVRLSAAQALRAANQGRPEVETAAKRADEAGRDVEAAALRAILCAWEQGI